DATSIVTGRGGTAGFSVAFSNSLPVGRFITATATDGAGSTSEFCACLATQPASAMLLMPGRSAEGLSLVWSAAPNLILETTASLSSALWVPATNQVTGAGAFRSVFVQTGAGAAQQFFRLALSGGEL